MGIGTDMFWPLGKPLMILGLVLWRNKSMVLGIIARKETFFIHRQFLRSCVGTLYMFVCVSKRRIRRDVQ